MQATAFITLILGILSRTRTEVGTYTLDEVDRHGINQEEYMGVIHPSFYLSEEDIQSLIQIEYNHPYQVQKMYFLHSPQDNICWNHNFFFWLGFV